MPSAPRKYTAADIFFFLEAGLLDEAAKFELLDGEIVPKMDRGIIAMSPKGNLAGWAQHISGRAAAAKAEWTQALAVVEKRIAVEPERADFLRWKAQLLALIGRSGEADKAWQLYVEMTGSDGAPVLPGVAQLVVALEQGRATSLKVHRWTGSGFEASEPWSR